MKRIVLGAMAAVAVSVSAIVLAGAAPGDQPSGFPGAQRIQHWAADHETLLDARLAGMKAGLKLSADQEKLWDAFETAVREGDKARMESLRDTMENREYGEQLSPIDRLEAMAERLSEGAAELKSVAEAAKPLYASLDRSQKRSFALLGREMLMPRGGAGPTEVWRRPGEGEGERGPGGME